MNDVRKHMNIPMTTALNNRAYCKEMARTIDDSHLAEEFTRLKDCKAERILLVVIGIYAGLSFK